MARTIQRSASPGSHKVLLAMAALAIAYCLGAPVVANLLAQGH